MNKIALNRDNKKRLVQADQILTLARGHYDAIEDSWSADYRVPAQRVKRVH